MAVFAPPPTNYTDYYLQQQARKKVRPKPTTRRAIPPRTATPPPPGSLAATVATATGNPWDDYLRQLDAREAAARDDAIRASAASSRGYMGALAGFGQALQGSAADAWQRILGSYKSGSEGLGAAQGAVADQFSAGLERGNSQLAADYAAIGQSGTPGTDAGAMTDQVRSVGGADPAGTLGLVGDAWGSYGETVPANVGFMTGQNIAQAARDAMTEEDKIRADFAQAMADNPEQAMAMWQNVHQSELADKTFAAQQTAADAAARQQQLENTYLAAKNKREADAAALVYQKFLSDQGKTAWQIAKDMTNFTGNVWGVNKKGEAYDMGRPAPGSSAGKAATSADTAKKAEAGRNARATMSEGRQTASDLSRSTGTVHVYDPKSQTVQDTGVPTEARRAHEAAEGLRNAGINISDQNLKIAQDREKRLAKGTKKGGYSSAQLVQLGKLAASIAGKWFYPVKDKKGDKDVRGVGTPEQALREMLSAGVPYSIAYNAIYQYAAQADNRRPGWRKALSWNPGYLSAQQKTVIAKGNKNRTTSGGR